MAEAAMLPRPNRGRRCAPTFSNPNAPTAGAPGARPFSTHQRFTGGERGWLDRVRLGGKGIEMSGEDALRGRGETEGGERRLDAAEVLAAVERMRVRAADAKLRQLDWKALQVDRDAGRC
jgi:hypothetical protein